MTAAAIPTETPIGLHLSQVARQVSRAFDETLAEAGGSLPVWLVLLNLKSQGGVNQRQLAEAVGITEATLTHHLNVLDTQGVLTRRRDPTNRRVHVVELTPAGEDLFSRLLGAARAFDQRLRHGFAEADVSRLRRLLDRLAANVLESAGGDLEAPPPSGARGEPA